MFIDYIDLVVRKHSKLSDEICNKYVADLMKFCELRNKEEQETPIHADNSMTFIFTKNRVSCNRNVIFNV